MTYSANQNRKYVDKILSLWNFSCISELISSHPDWGRMVVKYLSVVALLVLPLAACQQNQSNQFRTSQLVAIAGTDIQIGQFSQVNVDCSNFGTPRMVVVQQPTQGAVRSVLINYFPSFTQDNVRFKCNQQRVAGLQVNYIARPAASGTDRVIYDVVYVDGSVWRREVTINLR